MLQTTKGIEVKISWEQDGFKHNVRKMFYTDSVTEISLKADFAALKKFVTKAAKVDNVWVEVDYMDVHYHTDAQTRVILDKWMIDGSFKLEYRKYNGIDFSNKKDMYFPTQAAMIKFVIADAEKLVLKRIPYVPAERSLFLQSLDEKENVIEEI